MIYTVIVILAVLAAILMCAIVFIQESKGGGLASGFASGNSMLGVRKTTDVVEKTTWSLAGILVVLCVLSVFFLNSGSDSATANQSVTELQAGAAKEAATSAANQTAVPSTPAVVAEEAAPEAAPAEAAEAPAEAPAEAE